MAPIQLPRAFITGLAAAGLSALSVTSATAQAPATATATAWDRDRKSVV